MPSKSIGDRPLTPAERQAHQRQKHKARQEAMQQELERLRAENATLRKSARPMSNGYTVRYYDPEGCDSLVTREAPDIGQFATLDEARARIREIVGADHGCYDGSFLDEEEKAGLLECWHESEDEGCGGYAIYEAQQAAKPDAQLGVADD